MSQELLGVYTPPGEPVQPSAPVIIRPTLYSWRYPATIPPRQWLYGRHYIRKFLSCTLATGGVGKSSLAIVEALAIATGRELLGVQPDAPVRVWYWNGEDPYEESERRVAAICLHYQIAPDGVAGHFFLDSGRDQEIILAEVGKAGVRIAVPVANAVHQGIAADNIDVMIVDPFVSSHCVPENDNSAINVVAKAWAKIADKTGCSIDLIHHVRKTGGAEIGVEDGRGASSLIAAARSVRVLNQMSKDEAASAGVENHRLFFRVDNGKSNLAPPPDMSDWHHLVSEFLGNGGDGPSDLVGVATLWQWPNALDGVSTADLRRVQQKIAEREWVRNSQVSNWAGLAIGEVLDIDVTEKAGKARVGSLLKIWIENKVLRTENRPKPRTGRDQEMVVVGERV